MFLLISTPFAFFLFLDMCLVEAVKKQRTSGSLDTILYQCAATAVGVLFVTSATIKKHLVRFCGNNLTC